MDDFGTYGVLYVNVTLLKKQVVYVNLTNIVLLSHFVHYLIVKYKKAKKVNISDLEIYKIYLNFFGC